MPRERRLVRVTGTVQGVGFRPFVHRTAVALGLAGWVGNDGCGVVVEAEGEPGVLDELVRRLRKDAPPLALVAEVLAEPLPLRHDRGFAIAATRAGGAVDVPVSVDVAPCDACLAELHDPADRRHRYPFLSCTDCGPRWTIVLAVPYDRPATTMAGFRMCAQCRREYDDPADRRFHAQPNACPECGPQLAWEAGGCRATGDAALQAAVQCVLAGGVVAVKGVGGYHLAVDAADTRAVGELRRRKRRDAKPFAVLVADLAAARAVAHLDAPAETALTSLRRPVVLVPRRPGARLADGVAPSLAEVGLLLPPSPLHVLLAEDAGRPLVLTSGNVSDEPMVHTDSDARRRLGPLVDGLLLHDRPIAVRCDDSVARARNGGVEVVRRARGYAPAPLELPVPAVAPVLAVGAQLKSTVAVARGSRLVVSPHLGDLEQWPAFRAFQEMVDHLVGLSGVRPELVAHDLHPEYLSTKHAAELDLPLVGVQHHHAHVASCLLDHGETGPVLGVAFDGHGWGGDGTLWGGELLVADLAGFERVGHLRAVPLPGGAAAVRQPWRMAVVWAQAAAGDPAAAHLGRRLSEQSADVARLAASPHCLQTSSAGRLFDAVAALLGVRTHVAYEGQAAVELEALARSAADPPALPAPVVVRPAHGPAVLDPAPLVAALLDTGADGSTDARSRARLARAFHTSLAASVAALAADLAAEHALRAVALTGGVFANTLLASAVESALAERGLRVLRHRQLPCNDGGISAGQAAVAAARSTD